MRRLKSKLALGLALVITMSLFSACENVKKQEDGKTTITIGYLPITHSLSVLEEKELQEESDDNFVIQLQKFSSWTDLTDALNSGKIDGASMLIQLAMNAVTQGIDLKAVALGHKDGNVVIASNDIETAADLKGKTFAIPSNQSSHNILLNDMLALEGLSIDDINVIQLAPSEMPSSLASGTIDGYCVAEPFGAQAVVQEYGHVLYYSEELWENSICCALVLNNSFIQNNKETADLFIDCYIQAGEKLDSETAMSVARKYLGQEEETLEKSLQWIHYDNLAITKEEYDVLTEKIVSYGINDKPPSFEDFVYIP